MRAAALRLQYERTKKVLTKMDTSSDASDNAPPSWSMTPELRDIEDADSGMIQELLTLFLDDSAARLQTLNRACIQEDFNIMHNQAHSLKGSALQMGAPAMASLCAALEKSGSPETELREAMTCAIDVEFVLVRGAIEQYRARRESTGLSPQRGQRAVVAE